LLADNIASTYSIIIIILIIIDESDKDKNVDISSVVTLKLMFKTKFFNLQNLVR